jgi:L-iditol 2-dehydrogenase
MKEYILESPKKIKIAQKEEPLVSEDEVLIKVSNLGLCGSDIHLYNGTYKGPLNYPMLFGHEWSGTVSKTGSSVKTLKPGDKVTGDCSKYCGNCQFCSIDKNLCENIEKFGITTNGASAEYIVRKEKYVYKAYDDLDMDIICLAEPLAVSAHLLKKVERFAQGLIDKKVLIYGAGPIGLSALLILKYHYGLDDVYLYDIIKERIDLAKNLGAKFVDMAALKEKTGKQDYKSIYSESVFDAIIESTGNKDIFAGTLEHIKPSGIVGCLGMIGDAAINQKLIVIKAITITGSIGGTGDFPFVLDFIRKNKDKVKSLISHKIPAAEYKNAFELSSDASKTMKIQLVF